MTVKNEPHGAKLTKRQYGMTHLGATALEAAGAT